MKHSFWIFYTCAIFGCYAQASHQVVPAVRTLEVQDTITLLFAGDLMCHKPQVTSAKTGSSYAFLGWFKYIEDIIQDADIAFVNLETTLSAVGRYSGYPRFKSPDELSEAIAASGFDVVVTANNHSNDTGPRGVIHTIDQLKSLGLYQTGTFKNEVDKALTYPLIFEKAGLKMALLNYTYNTNGIPTRPPTMVNEIDTIQIKQDIAMARVNSPDLIIAFMHWGYEYHTKPNLKQQRMARMMIKAGVDHIIGAHPHVVQPIEIVDNHLVAYSLGNFISNQKKPLTDGGIMVELKLVKTEGNTKLVDWSYIPVWRYIRREPRRSSYEILPTARYVTDTTHFESLSDLKQMVKYDQYINKHLSK